MTINQISTSIIPNVLPVSMSYRLSSACARALDSLTNLLETRTPTQAVVPPLSGTAQDSERIRAADGDLLPHGFRCVTAMCW
jgi:hypothetical protein